MNQWNPVNYKIRIKPDLSNFYFYANLEILLEAVSPMSEISLNIIELAIWRCQIKDGPIFRDCSFYIDNPKEELKIILPDKSSGQITLKIDYTGRINNQMAGFYCSKYTSIDGKARVMAVTQFEESDARRAFPCMDHPSKKATFDIELEIQEGLTGISNEQIKQEKILDKGKKLVIFKTTPRMSTYLVFFAVGEFEFIVDKDDPRMRVATLAHQKEYAHFGLDFGRKSLIFCEDYFGVNYPMEKLDLISIPDFAFGAMENWGAITFRENLLLHYPEITSRAGEERICEVIAHEIVHQWFGNLVTPSEWKYLWLNESFATYFGFKIVDKYYPSWDIWHQFFLTQTDVALERDALLETIPIEIPAGEHVVINSSTAPIIYNKGGNILRQVKDYMGDSDFQAGLVHYLNQYQYTCTYSSNLWESMEEKARKPIKEIMKSWIDQPGFPIVEVDKDGDKLIFKQERFTYLKNTGGQSWLIPLKIKIFYDNGDSKEISTLLDSEKKIIDVDAGISAYKVNASQTGFYRVKYKDQNALKPLGKLIENKQLPPEDRWGLQNDLFAMVRRADATIDDYLGFLAHYTEEDSALPLISIASHLFYSFLVTTSKTRQKIADFGKTLIENILNKIGLEPQANERHLITDLRDQIIFPGILYGSTGTGEFARKKFSGLMEGGFVQADILRSIMKTGAFYGDQKTFNWFVKRLDSSSSEHDRINVLTAMACFRETPLIEMVLQYIMDKVPARNKFIPIGALANNSEAIPLLWNWFKSNLARIEAFHPVHFERVVSCIIPSCGIDAYDEVKDFFGNYLGRHDKAADTIKLSLEKLEINIRVRNLSVI